MSSLQFRSLLNLVAPKLSRYWLGRSEHFPAKVHFGETNAQRLAASLLRERFKTLHRTGCPDDHLFKQELKVYSQNGEDGIIAYIMSTVGPTNHSFVEVAAGNGIECNTANLAINFGWQGLMVDVDEQNVLTAKRFYQSVLGPDSSVIRIVKAWVTPDNVNGLLKENGVEGEIDLLSIDIDGQDYWLWKAITAVNPRVVVIEYNSIFGDEESLTVPRLATFARSQQLPDYFGASLVALTKLAHELGYVLVGCVSAACNAFYVRKDVAHGKLHERSPKDAYYPRPGQFKPWGERVPDFSESFDRLIRCKLEHV